MPTSVVNLRSSTDFDVYVGRAGTAPCAPPFPGCDGRFGNPVLRGAPCPVCSDCHAEPEATLPCFTKYFLHRIVTDLAFRAAVIGLHGKRLACWCAPNPCHGSIIAHWVDGCPLPPYAYRQTLTHDEAVAAIVARMGEV